MNCMFSVGFLYNSADEGNSIPLAGHLSMQDNKKHLSIIKDEPTRVVDGTTCFAMQAKQGVDCNRQCCKNWISYPEGHNCVMIAAQDGPHTLQKIGQIYGLTRMRICQIEKNIFEKIRSAS